CRPFVVPGSDADDAIGAGDVEGGIEQVVRELEERGARTDRDGQRNHTNSSEPGRFREHAYAELQVHRPAGEPAERAWIRHASGPWEEDSASLDGKWSRKGSGNRV